MSKIGDFVLIRATGAGVHCGILIDKDGDTVKLAQARRVWRWRGANTLNELSVKGASKESFTRISEPVETITILGVHEIIGCTAEGRANLEESRWLD